MLLCLLFILAPVNSQYLNVTNKVLNVLSNPCTDKNHLVLAPGVLKSGGINRACVSRFHPDGPARLLLTLLTEDLLTTTASRELPPGDGGCLDISVPQLPNTKADLIVKLQYPEAQCTWERRLTLRISSGRVLVVQSERARYRPGETVRARILALKPDLAPSHGSIEEVWLEGPQGAWQGTRVAQWLRVRTRLGLAQLQYQLDTFAPSGKWTLRAKLEDGSQGSAVFWVGHYELPPFQLSVRHAPKVLKTSERLVWTVCVRYPWSEAVEGMLVIRLRGSGGGGAGVRTAVQLRAPKACHRHAVAAKRVGLHSQNPPEVLVADFSFQEEGTRIWQNTTVVSQVVDKPITLEFLTKHRAVISRGLPYKLKVKATRWDDKPGAGELLRVCRRRADGAAEPALSTDCAEGETDASGVARLMFAAVQTDAPFYKFQAQLKNDSTTSAWLSVRVVVGAVQAALGPLRADRRSARTLVPLYVTAHVTAPLTVHFVVITRGGIIYRWGATTQCPTSNSDQIHTASRNYKCNENYYSYNRDVTAQKDNIANADDIDTPAYRSKRSFEVLPKSEHDPNAIDIDNIVNPRDNSKTAYDQTKIDFDPNLLKIFLSNQTHKTEPQISIRDIFTRSKNVSYKTEAYIGPTFEEIKRQPQSRHIFSTRPTVATSQEYHRPGRVNPSPVSLTANQSKKYHLILRNSRTYPQDQLVPEFRLRQVSTQSPHQYTNMPTVGHSDVIDNVTAVTSDALLDRKLKIMLPIKVSHQMCPDSHLIAYFYYNGELVSAAKHFEMDECFANKVEASWLSRQAQPGSWVSLQVSSPGPALCALSALDAAAKWLQPPPSTRELLMSNLRRLIESHRNLTEYDAAGECFLNSDTPDMPSTSMELTAYWLASAGVRVLGGEAPRAGAKRCGAPPPAALRGDDPAPRTDFSEAWLWRVMPIGANGTGVVSARAPDSITRYEAAVTCVSKNGVAVSPPAVLQVFREFFIHADGPKRLRRGDSAIIRYRIFNYLYEPLSVQIQVLTDPHIEAATDSVETACIAARSSIARRVTITARVASPARLSLRAKTANDGNCPNVTTTVSVSDEVIIKMLIDPEGVPVHEQKSILLCGDESEDQRGYNSHSASQIEWAWPRVEAVPGTETLTLWAAGDMTGPLIADADSLVTIPRGCGEQNMAQLATNLLALKQLEPTSIAALIAREHVARGFTRQLQYVHPSGGFSAFGPSDVTSSTWLTAFAVKHLRKANQLLWPNVQTPPALIRAERWLLSQQMENGCFRNEGQVFHRELRGGLNEEGEIASVALTAYVITALIDNTTPVSYRVIRNTLSCLRALPPLKSQSPTRVYAQALLAYAFTKIEKYEEDLRKTNNVNLMRSNLEENDGDRHVLELLKVAKRSDGYVWWEANSLSTSIEATSYAVLALRGRVWGRGRGGPEARAALSWLAAHRSAGGGFVATQDTLVALEALTAWSSGSPSTHLNVTVRSDDRAQTLTLLPGARIPEVISLMPGDRLNVNVQGKGCALVQATRSYHTVSTPEKEPQKLLSVQVAVHTDGPFDCDTNNTACFCAAVIEVCVMWSGKFPEMALLEVSLPGGYGADAQLLYSQLYNPSSLLRRIELSPTNSRATLYLGTRDGNEPTCAGGHQCCRLHAVGPRAHTRHAYVRVQDYYAPEHNDTQLYTIPEDCPPRISHDLPQYTSSDNLFSKAKALEGDEILITNDFTYEDIPEGIPLEDPLYDNLTQREEDSEEIEKYIENTETSTANIGTKDLVQNTTGNVTLDNFNRNADESQRYENSDLFVVKNETIDNVDSNADIHSSHHNGNSDLLVIKKETVNVTPGNVNYNATELEPQHKKNNDTPVVKNATVNVTLDNVTRNIVEDGAQQSGNIHAFVGKNTTINVTLDNLNRNAPEHEMQHNRNFDKFTLNNVERTQFPLSTTRMDAPFKVELNKHIQNTDKNINPPINNRENNRGSLENVVEATVKAVLAQKITQPIDNKPIDNPNLADFHVIDTEKDLEVPSGVEGPIPAVVLPPKGFVAPQQEMARRIHTVHTSRGSYLFFEPEQFQRRYFVPKTRTSSGDWNHYKIKKTRR
ncbi:unnamed protein product [Arctia plantaginis]|uniref:Alpha-2-macroglobulin-like protein 1 n=1 Tax=Arctia plantaginis TaxID=874455 RepID=A0A8S0YLB8_ARCPL|nr:unnamed protein product [Arctia plantaginis]